MCEEFMLYCEMLFINAVNVYCEDSRSTVYFYGGNLHDHLVFGIFFLRIKSVTYSFSYFYPRHLRDFNTPSFRQSLRPTTFHPLRDEHLFLVLNFIANRKMYFNILHR